MDNTGIDLDIFENTAKELFEEANVNPEEQKELFAQSVSILSSMMAKLSTAQAFGGITVEDRVRLYNDQKETIVNDLKTFVGLGMVEDKAS